MAGNFALILKTAKVVPIFKKDSKLIYSNHIYIVQSPCCQILKKILEKLIYKRWHTFHNNNYLSQQLPFHNYL